MCRGNWSVDLQAGSEFGYKLLFAVLISGLGAVILQVCAVLLMLRRLMERMRDATGPCMQARMCHRT